MAQKIKLDLDSTDSLDFESTVDIPTPSGAPIKIPFTFVYRDRLQMAQLFDAFVAEAKAAEPAPDTTMVDAVDAAIGSDVALIKRVATGWGLEAAFDDTNLRKLCTRYSGAGSAILSHYRVALTQGRLGN